MSNKNKLIPGLLGQFVRARRSALGLSQDSLSRISGVSRRVITRLERETDDPSLIADPRLPTLDQLARALLLDVPQLVSGNVASNIAYCGQESQIRVAGNFARLRKEFGFSQERLSEASGRFRTYVHRIEVLAFTPCLSDVESIANQMKSTAVDVLAPISDREYRLRLARRDRAAAPGNLHFTSSGSFVSWPPEQLDMASSADQRPNALDE
ncbi:helix-turn-helix transcriptional regulator [Paraburkholderia bengalensis]|uniref:Helix-turn-helix transcriptional regulator n=1 Tax=Paraburkholderia bengalensis TaxID=2747562 RepID=A0ABU8IL29_9BURK